MKSLIFTTITLGSFIVSLAASAKGLPLNHCNSQMFDLSSVAPGESRTIDLPTPSAPEVQSLIGRIISYARQEFGSQNPCISNSMSCFGKAGESRFYISRIKDPFHNLIASRGSEIEILEFFGQNTPYTFGIYDIAECAWGFPGKKTTCIKQCVLIADPSPGS